MSNKKQTAVMQTIQKMNEAKDNYPKGFSEEFMRGFNQAFILAIFISKEVGLELEKQQIENAHQNGFYCGNDIANATKSEFESAEQYYNETYEK